jgi:hypothetical protein
MATEGGRISPPGCWGGSRPPQWPDLFFFLVRQKRPKVGGEWRWLAASVAGGGRWVIYLVAGFVGWVF